MATTPDTPAREGSSLRPSPPAASRTGGLGTVLTVLALITLLAVGVLGRDLWGQWLNGQPAVATWVAVFVAIALQAFPFLVLGVSLSAVIAVYIPADTLRSYLPENAAAAVPVAGISGALLPGCECASVPIAGSLVARGVAPAAALTFLLAAPAINPVVLVSTSVAFGGDWRIVLARYLASLITAVVMGWWWLHLGRDDLIRLPHAVRSGGSKFNRFTTAVTHDLLHAGGFLVVGAAIAAVVAVFVPRSVLDTLSSNLALAVITLAVFAVIVAVCSEADAFVAASLTAFPLTARLVFMVVGPALDVKLFAMQVGTFGRAFAIRFAPMTLLVAVTSAVVVGQVLL
ncbi:permease [Austwickia chelonae]|uniref:permease n=1 Tax=Austwickia chelonae TaxID=100225 RepID=UPI00058E5BB4|nr:permease [Austwickia chelonae]